MTLNPVVQADTLLVTSSSLRHLINLNMHTPMSQRNLSGLTMLSRHSVGT